MCQEASKYIMTISEVSEKYGLTADTLRYYERIGLLPRVARKANGVRDYRQEDCQMIGFIKCLRGAGMPVDLLIQYFGLVKQGGCDNPGYGSEPGSALSEESRAEYPCRSMCAAAEPSPC